jgi:NADPH-dependent F420 reductase
MARTAVAVLGGTGQQGGGLARRLARAGHEVIVGSRDAARAASTVRGWGDSDAVSAATYEEAVARAAVVMLTVPFDAVDALLADLSTRFVPGTLLIDVTVPLTFAGGAPALAALPEGSAAEHVRSRLPPSVGVAAAFKTLPARVLHTVDAPLDCDEFVCGDSDESRSRAAALVGALDGLRAIDVGPLSGARAIEHLTLLAVAINRRHKRHGARFKVVGL